MWILRVSTTVFKSGYGKSWRATRVAELIRNGGIQWGDLYTPTFQSASVCFYIPRTCRVHNYGSFTNLDFKNQLLFFVYVVLKA
jgi:hypothetical protein